MRVSGHFTLSAILITAVVVANATVKYDSIVLNSTLSDSRSDEALVSRSLGLYNYISKGVVNSLWESLPGVIARREQLNVSRLCADSLQSIHDGLRRGRLWAFRFVDASAKTPSGLLEGTISSFGDYDQCLDISVRDEKSFDGQYCMLKLLPVQQESSEDTNDDEDVEKRLKLFPMFGGFPMNNAICLPSTCSADEVRTVVANGIVNTIVNIVEVPICDTKASTAFDWAKLTYPQIVSLTYIALMISVVYWSTILDIIFLFTKGYRGSRLSRFLRIFSGNFNTYKLMQYKSSGRESSVDDIRYIFALSTATIHSYACGVEFRAMMKISRLEEDFQKRFYSFWAQPFFNVVGIEAFFCIGGLTALMSTYSIIEKGFSGRTVFKTIVFRWLRFGPAIMSLLALDLVWPLFGSGPLFSELSSYVQDNCSRNWWKSLLMVNNYDGPGEMCLVHTWYISVEFQLFILGVAAVCLIRTNKVLGLSFCYLMVLLGMIIPGAKAYIYNYPPTFIMGFSNINDVVKFVSEMYLPTYCHLSPYFIGLIVGYHMKTGSFSMRMNPIKRLVGFFFFLAFFGILYFPAYWNTYKYPMEPVTSAIFSVTHRVLWTLGFLSVIMFMKDAQDFIWSKKVPKNESENNNVQNGNGKSERLGFRTSPEMKHFMIVMMKCIGKLYFSLYLVHTLYIRFDWFRSRQLHEFNGWANSARGVYSVMNSLVLAYYFHVIFEAPLENIRQYLKGDERESKKDQSNGNGATNGTTNGTTNGKVKSS